MANSSLTSAGPTAAIRVTVARDIWMRRSRYTLINASFRFAFAAFWVWLAYYAANGGPRHGGVGMGIFGGVLAAAFALVGAREARSGLRMGPDGIVVRGPLLTYKLSPNDVVGFVAEPAGKWPPSPTIQRKHRRPLRVSALSRGGLLTSRYPMHVQELQPLCEELNALLRTLQSGGQVLTPDAVLTAEEGARRDYRTTRAVVLAFAALYPVIGALIIALHPTAVVIAGVAVVAVLDVVSTWLLLRQVRRQAAHNDNKMSS